MSIKKPIIKVTRKCSNCKGLGYIHYGKCKKCSETGLIDVRKNAKDFKKYYIKDLEELIEYWTGLYRRKNNEAQEYLKRVGKYSKELDKVVNK